MKIVIASDSYKGSSSSLEVANSIEKGLLRSNLDLDIVKVAVADGGEGTMEALVLAFDGYYKEVEVLDKNNACSKVSEIIDGVISTSEEEGLNHKAIVFNNINHARVNGLIDGLKKFKIGRPLMAFVTEDNKNWTFNNLLLNLLEEREALKNGKKTNH